MAKKGSKKQKLQQKRREQQIQRLKRRDAQRRATVLPVRQLTESDIANYRAEMEKVIIYANDRIDELHRQGLTTVELNRFQDGDPNRYFSLPSTNNPDELRAYMTTVRVVLSSISENSNKALLDTAMLEAAQYRGQFGNKYSGRHFNVNDIIDESGNIIRTHIDENIASIAFRAYRNLESEYGPLIGRQGQEGVFGSENLIIAIYDYYARGMDGQLYGRDLLEAWQTNFLREMEGVNWTLDQASAIVTKWDDFLVQRMF